MATYIGQTNYVSSETREKTERADERLLFLNPWTVQSVVYEILQNYMLTNEPKSMGYTFSHKYALKKEESGIDLDIAYNFKPDTASKRPAIFIARGDAQLVYPTMGNLVGSNVEESEEYKLAKVRLPINTRGTIYAMRVLL